MDWVRLTGSIRFWIPYHESIICFKQQCRELAHVNARAVIICFAFRVIKSKSYPKAFNSAFSFISRPRKVTANKRNHLITVTFLDRCRIIKQNSKAVVISNLMMFFFKKKIQKATIPIYKHNR